MIQIGHNPKMNMTKLPFNQWVNNTLNSVFFKGCEWES